MRHVVVSRFSVPRLDAATARHHLDRDWLTQRLGLFRRYFVPSVGRCGVPVILLCSTESAESVAAGTADLPWVEVVVQDDWHAGWYGAGDQMVTRLDTDDALHEGWFRALEAAPPDFEVYCTKHFLRLDVDGLRLYDYSRRVPSPLAAFRGGANPYAHDHAELEGHHRVHLLPERFLLQVVHGANLSNRRPRWLRFYRRVALDRLRPFGLDPEIW